MTILTQWNISLNPSVAAIPSIKAPPMEPTSLQLIVGAIFPFVPDPFATDHTDRSREIMIVRNKNGERILPERHCRRSHSADRRNAAFERLAGHAGIGMGRRTCPVHDRIVPRLVT